MKSTPDLAKAVEESYPGAREVFTRLQGGVVSQNLKDVNHYVQLVSDPGVIRACERMGEPTIAFRKIEPPKTAADKIRSQLGIGVRMSFYGNTNPLNQEGCDRETMQKNLINEGDCGSTIEAFVFDGTSDLLTDESIWKESDDPKECSIMLGSLGRNPFAVQVNKQLMDRDLTSRPVFAGVGRYLTAQAVRRVMGKDFMDRGHGFTDLAPYLAVRGLPTLTPGGCVDAENGEICAVDHDIPRPFRNGPVVRDMKVLEMIKA